MVKISKKRTRPSEVVARRLREVRQARRVSQEELADRMTAAGYPLTKAAVNRIENGKRKITFDETLALAWVLEVVPFHLFSPYEDEHVFPGSSLGLDGVSFRNWLVVGDPLLLTPRGKRARANAVLWQKMDRLVQDFRDVRELDDDARRDVLRRIAGVIKEHRQEVEKTIR